jgi:hypothetical protein
MSLVFDNASDQVINCGNDSSLGITDQITMMVWVNRTESQDQGLFYKGGASQNGDYAIKLDTNDKPVTILNDAARHTATTALNASTWYLVSSTYDKDAGSNEIKSYLNDAADGTSSYSTAITSSADNFQIGRYFSAAYDYTGELRDLRIYNRVLSLAEIGTIYHARGADNITTGLQGRWLMNELPAGSNCTAILDLSPNANNGSAANNPVYAATDLKELP